ncbi:MAG: nucleotidyltransferase domain-containing protein [Spirochaetaceae bacterium]|nr:nucleotidyltransferase domain-containing protein [Spirochaetaceae bacterium]
MDNNAKVWGKKLEHGLSIYPSEKVLEGDFDFILVDSTGGFKEIPIRIHYGVRSRSECCRYSKNVSFMVCSVVWFGSLVILTARREPAEWQGQTAPKRCKMNEDIRWIQRFQNFSRAFILLRSALEEKEIEDFSELEQENWKNCINSFLKRGLNMADVAIKQEELSMILPVLQNHKNIERALVFGSRAKGNAKLSSDIDIAVFGNIDFISVEKIILDLEELPMLQKFDVLSYNDIKNNALKQHIDRVGIPIYEK